MRVVRIAERLCNQSIIARDLIKCWHEKRVVYEINARCEGPFDTRNHQIEVVIGAERDLPRYTDFRCVDVHIIETSKAW